MTIDPKDFSGRRLAGPTDLAEGSKTAVAAQPLSERQVMDAWASFATAAPSGNVVPIGAAR